MQKSCKKEKNNLQKKIGKKLANYQCESPLIQQNQTKKKSIGKNIEGKSQRLSHLNITWAVSRLLKKLPNIQLSEKWFIVETCNKWIYHVELVAIYVQFSPFLKGSAAG